MHSQVPETGEGGLSRTTRGRRHLSFESGVPFYKKSLLDLCAQVPSLGILGLSSVTAMHLGRPLESVEGMLTRWKEPPEQSLRGRKHIEFGPLGSGRK